MGFTAKRKQALSSQVSMPTQLQVLFQVGFFFHVPTRKRVWHWLLSEAEVKPQTGWTCAHLLIIVCGDHFGSLENSSVVSSDSMI